MNLNDHQPVSLTDAIKLIVDNLDEEEHHYINMNGAEGLHFSAGMAIRNAWIHPEDAPLKKHLLANFGPLHADDMSGMILSGLTAAVRKEKFDPYAEAKKYQEFWRDQNVDPLTGGPYGESSSAS